MDDRDYKYNNLLREIELKEMHITSLENQLKRKEDEIMSLKESKRMILNSQQHNMNNIEQMKKFYNQNQQQNLNYQPTSEETEHFSKNYSTLNKNFSSGSLQNLSNFSNEVGFQRNEDNEKELRKLVSNPSNSGNNIIIENSISSNNNNQDNSTSRNKTPGKIYSSKRKVI
jgi:hypothetical protein